MCISYILVTPDVGITIGRIGEISSYEDKKKKKTGKKHNYTIVHECIGHALHTGEREHSRAVNKDN